MWALHSGETNHGTFLLKIFMTVDDERTLCAKATHAWELRDRRSDSRAGMPTRRETTHAETVSSVETKFCELKLR